jgi:hypothetical protein
VQGTIGATRLVTTFLKVFIELRRAAHLWVASLYSFMSLKASLALKFWTAPQEPRCEEMHRFEVASEVAEAT